MLRKASLIVGVLMILLGGLWILQGVGIVGGSFMSGQPFWSTTGTVVLVVGVVLCALGLRGGRSRTSM
jgi:hypothetical protein